MRRPVLFLVLLLPVLDARGIIIDTLRGFDERASGWQGAIRASGAAKGGNTERQEILVAGRVQWRHERHRVRLLSGGEWSTGRDEKLEDEFLIHLRHNYRLRGPWSTVLFVQQQHSPFQDLHSRILTGGGLRVDVVENEQQRWALGATQMWEWEDYSSDAVSRRTQRLSTFTLLRLAGAGQVSLDLVAFLQPRWADFQDLRTSGNATLNVRLNRRLRVLLSAGVEHDSRPPIDVDETDWATTVGLEWNLNTQP